VSSWPYNTANWQRLRTLKLQENALCELCFKQQRLVIAEAVDHIVSINAGGDPFPALDQLMSLCTPCHNRKTRIVEQQGQPLIDKGFGIDGMPLDPNHPWFRP
jgi:5-methylcytosine-specific restriction enzyme A